MGQGEGFVGQIARLRLQLDGTDPNTPASLIAKFPIALAQNRALGELTNAYEREIRFYEELADQVEIRTPRCYYSALDPGPFAGREEAVQRFFERLPAWLVRWLTPLFLWLARHSRRRYVLFLEDLAPARPGDQVAGCTPERAEQALAALAAAHAGLWADTRLDALVWVPKVNALAGYLQAQYLRARRGFFETYGARMPPVVTRIADWLDTRGVDLLDHLAAPPLTLLHGDYRLDNLFLGDSPDGSSVTALDWQAVTRGRAALDVAYFVTGNLDAGVAAGCEQDLLERYHRVLVERGVRGYGLEALRCDYELAKLAILHRWIMGVHMIDLSGERGTRLLDLTLARLTARLPEGDYDALLATPGRGD